MANEIVSDKKAPGEKPAPAIDITGMPFVDLLLAEERLRALPMLSAQGDLKALHDAMVNELHRRGTEYMKAAAEEKRKAEEAEVAKGKAAAEKAAADAKKAEASEAAKRAPKPVPPVFVAPAEEAVP